MILFRILKRVDHFLSSGILDLACQKAVIETRNWFERQDLTGSAYNCSQ